MPKFLKSFFSKNILEIYQSTTLLYFGFFLALTHGLSGGWWLSTPLWRWMTKDSLAICWPFFDRCSELRFLGDSGILILLVCYVALSLFVASLFLNRKYIKAGFILLLLLEALKVFILLLDYRLRMNQHYMAFWVSLIYLFYPSKLKNIKIIIPLFYFWAGVLKLNKEWLSGSALYGKIWFFHDSELLPWACLYVVFLELVFIWGLWSKKGTLLFTITLIQLFLFHLFSYSVVSFFYPLLMFCLLSIFILQKNHDKDKQQRDLGFPLPISSYLLILIFSSLQIFHHLMPGDTALTGEGRFFGLHMFDAKVQCRMSAYFNGQNNSGKIDLLVPAPIRLKCDPVVAINHAKHLCRKGVHSFTLRLESKRQSDEDFKVIINIPDFCKEDISYSIFKHNSWILTEPI